MATKDKNSSAGRLIASAKTREQKHAPLPPKAVKALREVCEYNDGVHGNHGRVSAAAALAMLREDFGWRGSRVPLDCVCREQLGRASYAQRGEK